VTEWWEQRYPSGPMVEVPGFPRPLYPPDAADHGYRPSADGPDVVAYQRTVSRLGRWPWTTFDDSYSNEFAHGTSGSVGETGVAGFQRQQHVDATGFIGTNTFDALRSALVPEALPHAGEPAMDDVAAQLIADAWELFGGSEPPPEPSDTVRELALAAAIGELGVTESPPGSNQVEYASWYGVPGQPWCAMFVTWCYEQGGPSPSFVAGTSYAYVPYVVADARGGHNGLTTTGDPIPGDLVCFDWDWDGEFDHIGLFEGWQASGTFTAIEGNTSTTDNSNGGEVMRRTRQTSGQSTVFVRVTEP
jgi:hypothetical protein